MSFLKEFDAYCANNGVPERIELLLCDANGILRGKWLDGADVEKLDKGDVRLPLSTHAPNIFGDEVEATGLGIIKGDPDGKLVPILGTLAPVPWMEYHCAQVLVDLVELDGAPSLISSRVILQQTLDKFSALGLRPVVASELEFYIFHERENAREMPRQLAMTQMAQNYELEIMDKQADILRAIKANARELNLPLDAVIAEYGPGQFEINFHHTDNVMLAADQAIMFRRMVRGTVAQFGMQASFAAKPFLEVPGNGMHLHASILNEDGKNIFDTDGAIHEKLRAAIAGCLEFLEETQLIFAPHGNSYRRFTLGGFSPTTISWAQDDRRAGIRVPQATGPAARMEHRIAGADIQLHLAFAAILFSMLVGIEDEMIAPEALTNETLDQVVSLTDNWGMAIEKFAHSAHAKQLLGDAFHFVYTELKRDELRLLNAEITPAEAAAYIGRI